MKKKVNVKEKVKAFWKEHGIEIEAGATVIGVALLSGFIGYQLCKYDLTRKGYVKLDGSVKEFLDSANRQHAGKMIGVHRWWTDDPTERFKVSDLGKLGDQMRVAEGVSFDDAFGGFTHILSIGPED